MRAENYKDLEIWKKGMDFCERVYIMTNNFPKGEQYGLTIQMRRASVSIVANIAEGFGRRSNNDFRRFIDIAKGSLLELETHIHLAQRLKYLNTDEAALTLEEASVLGKMITRFHQNMS